MKARCFVLTLSVCLSGCTERAVLPAPRTPLVATARAEFPAAPAVPSLHRHVSIPAIHTRTLANGLRVYVVAQPAARDITVSYLARAGSENRDLATLGLSTLAMRSMHHGHEAPRPRGEGAQLSSEEEVYMGAVRDTAYIIATAHPATLDAALADLAATLLAPAPPKSATDDAASEQLDRLHDGLYDQIGLARLHAMQMLYGNQHPLGNATVGLHQNLLGFTLNQLEPHRLEIIAPDTSALLVSGDVDPVAVGALVERHLAAVPAEHAEQPPPPQRQATGKRVRALQTSGGIAQIVQAFRAPPRDHADFVPFRLLSIAAGELTSSRLNLALREKYEKTYSIYSHYRARRDEGTFMVETQVAADAVADTLEKIDAEIARLRSAPLDARELSRAKLQARERIAHALEYGEGTVGLMTELLIEERTLPDDPRALLERELARIDAVTAADVQRAASTYLHAENRGVSVAGPLSEYAWFLEDWCNGQFDIYVPKKWVHEY